MHLRRFDPNSSVRRVPNVQQCERVTPASRHSAIRWRRVLQPQRAGRQRRADLPLSAKRAAAIRGWVRGRAGSPTRRASQGPCVSHIASRPNSYPRRARSSSTRQQGPFPCRESPKMSQAILAWSRRTRPELQPLLQPNPPQTPSFAHAPERASAARRWRRREHRADLIPYADLQAIESALS